MTDTTLELPAVTNMKIVLTEQEAIDLWLSGKDSWNAWVEEHPEADVDFSGMDFSYYLRKSLSPSINISFVDFRFPNGAISFSRTQFGEGEVFFTGAQFGDRGVSFFKAQFGKGHVIFLGANFGNGSVDFSQAQFGEGGCFYEAQFGNGNVNFTQTQFGNGDVDFTRARFSDGKVDFSQAQFGDRDVSFVNAQFGKGDVDFSNAEFGEGNVAFSGAMFDVGKVSFFGTTFGEGIVNFDSATFGKGIVIFSDVKFGKGKASFYDVTFGEGGVNFDSATFGKGNVHFDSSKFGKGDVDFSNAEFGQGSVTFSEATFGEGKVNFSDATFGVGSVNFFGVTFGGSTYFIGTTFGSGNYNFERINFIGSITLSELKNTEAVKKFSFKYSSFEKAFDLTGNFNCIVDLSNTKTSHQVSLHGLTCKLNRSWGKSVDPEDAARLRRLKDLAESNKDHESARAFHADEMRAKRWIKTGFWASWLDMAFSGFSNYGQSIARPIALLASLIVVFTGIYSLLATKAPSIFEAFQFSLSNSVSFLPISRDARIVGLDILFGAADSDKPYYIYSVIGLQGFLSFGAIFLIGLALRNRFRI